MRSADSSASSWYDCCGYSELATLFMIDSLGVKDKNTLYFLDWYIEKLVICVWPAKSFASSFICACLNPGGAMANSGPMKLHPYWYWNCLTFHFWLGRKHNNIDDFHRHNLMHVMSWPHRQSKEWAQSSDLSDYSILDNWTLCCIWCPHMYLLNKVSVIIFFLLVHDRRSDHYWRFQRIGIQSYL